MAIGAIDSVLRLFKAGIQFGSNKGIVDPSDDSKVLAFDVSGVTTGTVRTLLVPDHDIELGAISLTAAAESSNNIDVTVAGASAACQYIAELHDANMLESVVGAFTIAEVGDGAEVSTTAKPRLLFTTSAAGAATLRVNDVVTASGATIYLTVRPSPDSGGQVGSAEATIALTFD